MLGKETFKGRPELETDPRSLSRSVLKKGGAVKSYKQGGMVSSASKRADGIAIRGKTRGKMV
jgi:hypothetical protein